MKTWSFLPVVGALREATLVLPEEAEVTYPNQ